MCGLAHDCAWISKLTQWYLVQKCLHVPIQLSVLLRMIELINVLSALISTLLLFGSIFASHQSCQSIPVNIDFQKGMPRPAPTGDARVRASDIRSNIMQTLNTGPRRMSLTLRSCSLNSCHRCLPLLTLFSPSFQFCSTILVKYLLTFRLPYWNIQVAKNNGRS